MKPTIPDFPNWRVYFGSPEMTLRTAFRIRAALKKDLPNAKVIINAGPQPKGLARIVPAADAPADQISRAASIANATIVRSLKEASPPKSRS